MLISKRASRLDIRTCKISTVLVVVCSIISILLESFLIGCWLILSVSVADAYERPAPVSGRARQVIPLTCTRTLGHANFISVVVRTAAVECCGSAVEFLSQMEE